MPAYLPDFFVIPRQLHENQNIRPTDQHIYAVIYWFSQMRLQKCTLSNAGIAEMLNCNETTARKGIYRLIKYGYVEAVYKDDSKQERLELIPLVVMGGGTNGTHNKNIKEEIDNNNIVAERPIVNEKNNYIEVEPQNELSALAVTDKGRVEEAAKNIIGHFNDTYGTRYKTNSRSYQKNLEYWLEEYTVDEIKQAITNAKYDQYWAPIFKKGGQALELLLRKEKAKTGFGEVEKVDRIGQFLNTKVPTEVRPLTDIEFYQLCKKLNVPHDIVRGRYDFLMDKAGKGEFKNPDDEETVVSALTRWIEKDKSIGEVAECNEFEAMDIEDLHPRRKAEIQLFKKQSELQQVFDKFTQLKKKLDEAPEEEKETYKAQLRDIAPKGKQLQIEVGEAKALVKQMREAYGVS